LAGLRAAKKKLLVVAGAGATRDLGMLSVDEVHNFLDQSANRSFALASDPRSNLYGWLYNKIKKYWSERTHGRRKPNFEDILYAVSELAAIFPNGSLSALGGVVTLDALPDVIHIARYKRVDREVLRHLSQELIDDLLGEFRMRCVSESPHFSKFTNFFKTLAVKFEVAVVTTNYDNLIYRALPGIETGFDVGERGVFKQERIFQRGFWPCILHLHGSVHFDMDILEEDLHRIFWHADLTTPFRQNSFGRSGQSTTEGIEFPTSNIIAGYGKTAQMQRRPFRTYYSELDRMVCESDALLCLGYGFSDSHLNHAFDTYRDERKRRVIVIDWADDRTMTLSSRSGEESRTAYLAARIFDTPAYRMSCLGSKLPQTVGTLKEAREFERSDDSDVGGLSLWYGGMVEACQHADKVVFEISSSS
jgi:hypothetical protein